MESKSIVVHSRRNKGITCAAVSGHFATNHSHINYYVDLTGVKVRLQMARLAARELAVEYVGVPVDTIICLEGTEMIGAFLADEMTAGSGDICVLTPEFNSNNQLIFRENTKEMVIQKNILLLVSTASTGKTIHQALDCLQFYSGRLMGIGALFSAVKDMGGVAVQSIFSQEDIPDYKTYVPGQCAMCQQHLKIDAIANSFGYSRLS